MHLYTHTKQGYTYLPTQGKFVVCNCFVGKKKMGITSTYLEEYYPYAYTCVRAEVVKYPPNLRDDFAS